MPVADKLPELVNADAPLMTNELATVKVALDVNALDARSVSVALTVSVALEVRLVAEANAVTVAAAPNVADDVSVDDARSISVAAADSVAELVRLAVARSVSVAEAVSVAELVRLAVAKSMAMPAAVRVAVDVRVAIPSVVPATASVMVDGEPNGEPAETSVPPADSDDGLGVLLDHKDGRGGLGAAIVYSRVLKYPVKVPSVEPAAFWLAITMPLPEVAGITSG